ncbi:putative glycoprotein [Wenling tonguesole paramyxovirus]|uniref:Putative glycoprotein n=1 Tax=Wenling tonguesole paramyxovirus TaxID=2116454 RepID=A0A2P1GN01_9MONO|nr:putative glycoprotein [Wenling tonguesole paramyxovirus]AVM87377.1 putative glycoprotein [Wenling tonguesole paramyxovirus]
MTNRIFLLFLILGLLTTWTTITIQLITLYNWENESTNTTTTKAEPPQCATSADIIRLEHAVINQLLPNLGSISQGVTQLTSRPGLCYQAHGQFSKYTQLNFDNYGTSTVVIPNWRPNLRCVEAERLERTGAIIVQNTTHAFMRTDNFLAPTSIWTIASGGPDHVTIKILVVTSQVDLRQYYGPYIELGALSTRSVDTVFKDIYSWFFGFNSGYACLFMTRKDDRTSHVECFVANVSTPNYAGALSLPNNTIILPGSSSWVNSSTVLLGTKTTPNNCEAPTRSMYQEHDGICYTVIHYDWKDNRLANSRTGYIMIQRHWEDASSKSLFRFSSNGCRIMNDQHINLPVWWGTLSNRAYVSCTGADESQSCIYHTTSNQNIEGHYPAGLSGVTVFRMQGRTHGLKNGCSISDKLIASGSGTDMQCFLDQPR